jgi:hypothetical protein
MMQHALLFNQPMRCLYCEVEGDIKNQLLKRGQEYEIHHVRWLPVWSALGPNLITFSSLQTRDQAISMMEATLKYLHKRCYIYKEEPGWYRNVKFSYDDEASGEWLL